MRRLSALVGIVLALGIAVPASAVKPIGACPNARFDLMNYAAFRALSVSVGVPEALLGPEHLAAWQGFDKNDDTLACVMDLPDNAGTLGGWIFNVVDNTAHR
jgi:hypothetical protein